MFTSFLHKYVHSHAQLFGRASEAAASGRRPQPRRRPSEVKQKQWIISLLLRLSGTLQHARKGARSRIDPLWIGESFEHRRRPPKEPPALKGCGVAALAAFAIHCANLQCMEGFDLPEALHQWSQMKSRLADEPVFRRPYKQFWGHVSCHCDSAYEFCEVLKPIRVSLMMLADTLCCGRGLRRMAASMTTKE